MKYSLRPYQLDSVQACRDRYAADIMRLILVAPTGAGKTVIAAHLIESALSKGTRTLFLAHREELINQCAGKLDEMGFASSYGVIKAGDPRVNLLASIQIASVQTLTRRLDKLRLHFDLIIIDECHHARADSYERILKHYSDAFVLGLTATPYRADGKGLGDIFESLVEVTTLERLVADGFLVPSRVIAGRRINLVGVKTTAGDFNQHELAERVDRADLVGDIVSTWRKHAQNRLTLCFATTIEHSKHLRDEFLRAGVRAAHLDGEMDGESRQAVLRQLKQREIDVLCNVAVLTEGFDEPAVSCVILARPTKSRGLWRQIVGRALRPSPGKTDCLILDHANCTEIHGFITEPDKVDLGAGVAKDRPAPTHQCSFCGARFAGSPAYCPACGANLRACGGARELVHDDSVEMIEVDAATLRRQRQQRAVQEYYDDLQLAREIGQPPSWAGFRYKKKTGEFPDTVIRGAAPVKTQWRTKDGKLELAWA